MQGASVIAGIDRKTGAKAVFYGREKLLELSKKEDHSTLEGRLIIFSYDNASEELEYLAATVEVIKGYCSYQPGKGSKTERAYNIPFMASAKIRILKETEDRPPPILCRFGCLCDCRFVPRLSLFTFVGAWRSDGSFAGDLPPR
jgi:hypothetical protein